MTVGEFRSLTKDLPADTRVEFVIHRALTPDWLQGLNIFLVREQAPCRHPEEPAVRIRIGIDPEWGQQAV